MVWRLLQLCPAAHGRSDAVNKLERFQEDFLGGDGRGVIEVKHSLRSFPGYLKWRSPIIEK